MRTSMRGAVACRRRVLRPQCVQPRDGVARGGRVRAKGRGGEREAARARDDEQARRVGGQEDVGEEPL